MKKKINLRLGSKLTAITILVGGVICINGTVPVSAASSKVPGVTSRIITLGLLTTETGAEATTYAGTVQAVKGYINYVNANGGVDGRRIKLITADDESSPTESVVAAQSLVSRGAFGLIIVSTASPSAGAAYLASNGIPAVGICSDGPEWSNPSDKNLFSWRGCNGKYPVATTWGEFLEAEGVKKLAVVGYGSVPASEDLAGAVSASAKAVGIQTVLSSYAPTPGEVNAQTEALAIQSAGADSVFAAMSSGDDLTLAAGLQQAGARPLFFSPQGYSQTTVATPATDSAAQGDYSTISFRPIEESTPATELFVKNLKRYAGITGIPNFGEEEGWVTAEMAVAGLKATGKKLSRPAFIKSMHSLSGFKAGGLLPGSINVKTDWGQGENGLTANDCMFVVKLVGTAYVPQNGGNPYCGTLIPNSAANPSAPGPSY